MTRRGAEAQTPAVVSGGYTRPVCEPADVNRRRLLETLAALAAGTTGCTARSGGESGDETAGSPPTDAPAGTPTPPREARLRIVDRSFAAADGECAGGTDAVGEATVAFDAETVRVDGRLGTPTPCYGAALRDASLEGDTLVVAVARTSPPSEACVQCLGAVPYDATVRFAGGLPDEVTVEHDGEAVTTVRR